MIEVTLIALIPLALYFLLEYLWHRGRCQKCGSSFSWFFNSEFGAPVSETEPANTKTKWVREGNAAIEYVNYPLMWLNTCKKCLFTNECVCMFVRTDWEKTGLSRPVRDCPICSGAGKQNFTVGGDVDFGLHERKGRINCMFCEGNGFVSLEKLKTLNNGY